MRECGFELRQCLRPVLRSLLPLRDSRCFGKLKPTVVAYREVHAPWALRQADANLGRNTRPLTAMKLQLNSATGLCDVDRGIGEQCSPCVGIAQNARRRLSICL